ncbi:ribonuclease III [Candidatus Gottesmanbacteria bacterium RIFCSPHIGHO2_01_FULL_46_14]|uniref:Ribonuclease 3 n=2 Tax=Candidatus Gottesmaniibacteriota TaxID=1752720 RepID=A0A1F5ZS59_9BACT|nr:MAG: ribonuclease III [Candidatus Gottesmanbacteria bacterium RIFCSPHIGHO2_01_FULL_46_14]OGG30137.1 MAG: ribonuclease III [Candidatus Gottesmanbacteria bacterium RIFCSPLOWO2_01_FULL_46_21]
MTFEDLQKNLGITFTDLKLLRQAFAHRSYLNESRDAPVSNERLEFLGDAVLSFLTSHYLYKTFPDFPEGTLTNIRSSLVKTRSLADIATELGLGGLLLLSHGEEESGGRTNPSLLADTFEALLGAIFLDGGIETARTFVEAHVFPRTEQIIEKKSYIDFKSYLQEIIQEESKNSPTYRVTKSEGPDHAKTFWIEATAGEAILGSGTGRSKQEAEQQAALHALEKMGKI